MVAVHTLLQFHVRSVPIRSVTMADLKFESQMVKNSCYRCNKSGKCKGIFCMKTNKVCDGCLPGRLGRCLNSFLPPTSSVPMCSNSFITSSHALFSVLGSVLQDIVPSNSSSMICDAPSFTATCLISIVIEL